MAIRLPHRCIWISFAALCLLFVSSPAQATDAPPAIVSVETIGHVDPSRQIHPNGDRARVLLDEIIFRYEHVYFEFDSDKLLPGAHIALERKVEWLQENPSTRALIEGHCDIRGAGDYNLKLGQTRAQAVRTYLVDQGIDPKRIRIVTWGEARPQMSEGSDEAWSWNRRAEILPQ